MQDAQTQIRSPICVVVGHVDHGKTTLLDRIRGTTIALKEAGAITQTISSTFIPRNVIEKICGDLLKKFKFEITVPGLLFIDTPGHEAFTSLRRRGGSIADLAILVVDIIEGLMPQTIESLQILKEEKTPFVVGINKVDRIQGWQTKENISFLENFQNQTELTRNLFEEKFYQVVAQLSTKGFGADRFDRVSDFKRTVAAIPINGRSGEGIPELLALLVGLSQQFLKGKISLSEQAKGNVLEVKEVVGLGTVIDVILYDGAIHKSDLLVIGGKYPMITKIKALLEPEPLADIRTEKKFRIVDEIVAAAGVRISAPGLENVTSGSSLIATSDEKEAREWLQKFEAEKEEVEITAQESGLTSGLVLKADTVGSLEALINVFKNFQIEEATLGNISKETVVRVVDNEPFERVVIGFNVSGNPEVEAFAKDKGITILTSNVIYHLLDNYNKFIEETKQHLIKDEIETITRPSKIRILPGYVFRASSPAIVGVEVEGLLRAGFNLFKFVDDQVKRIGEAKQIQKEGATVTQAFNEKIALSISGPTVGRQINEGDILYSDISSEEYKKLKKFEQYIAESERRILEEIAEIKKKTEPTYGL